MLQSIYLPVAAIAIIGIGVLGVLLIRRGRRAADEDMFAAAPEAVPAGANPEVATPAGPGTGSPPRVDSSPTEWRSEHDLGASSIASREAARSPVEGPSNTRSAAAHAADPLGMVILDMLDGKGKLTGAELKRLDVFRPERIEPAAQSLELPPRLQSDEDAVLRLAQIQLYAATLELRSKWSATMSRGKDGVTDVPYSARDFRLKIARDIMDLPAPDRSETIGFLLGGLLNSPGSTSDLKRAVIDTVENLPSASLVNVLLDCLDDPDPIVQEYALAAADRLLDGQ